MGIEERKKGALQYRPFDHTADLGINITGLTVGELFVNGALAVFDLLTDLSLVSVVESREIAVEGVDWEDLLVNYLREVLYLYQGEKMLVREVVIEHISPTEVRARLSGEAFHRERHRLHREIKAVTYHGLKVQCLGDHWEARVLFDV